MPLDEGYVEVRGWDEMTDMMFSREFLSQNRPVKIMGMAESWGATQKWSDKDYLSQKGGWTTGEVIHLEAVNGEYSEY